MPIYPNVSAYPGQKITSLRPPDATTIPNQRGPSCGFYALGYVLSYWYAKPSTSAAVGKHLPPRTEMDKTKIRDQPRSAVERSARKEAAEKGQFTSLRQYGKYHNFTQYGSVFNAEAIVRIAEGASGGDFTGHVCVMRDEAQLIDQVKTLIDKECPVIIPYDVSHEVTTAGDPIHDSGKAAHWTTIVGYDKDPTNPLAFLHYTWGSYYRSLASDFARSCCCLTSNGNKGFLKCEIRRSLDEGATWSVWSRDWMATKRVDVFDQTALNGTFDFGGKTWKKTSQAGNEIVCQMADTSRVRIKVTKMKPGTNMEYCDPDPDWSPCLDFSKFLFPDYYKQNFVNPGLRGKLVVIYPSAATSDFR